ncbi:SDR family oxidoreductase [uncultured Paracoccus sp.]|uniref:SDR family NAD(P)-dependent oxidoreductase n=1 Tax=uncultured Paracoccus sp. TaxID=189685 RepID=UPI0026272927|nr:SDR family oxidoreductase [uncultured Paracoccus sp.]
MNGPDIEAVRQGQAAHAALFDVSGKVVLITGAVGGIGAFIAGAFAAAGARLVVADRSAEAAKRLADQLENTTAVSLDVAHKASCATAVSAAMEAYGGLHVLINCAGVNTRLRPEAYDKATWDQIVDVNLKGTFLMSQAAYPALKGGGKIVNFGSILSLASNAVTAPYSASKGGVLQLTRSLACAWAEDGISVNAILPGWIDTPLSRQARIDIPGHAERVVETTPMRRWGMPADLVGATIFLSSSASDFVTGAHVVVDGGVMAQV